MSSIALPPNASVEEVEDEIAFTHCMLGTLDQDAEDFEDKREEINEALMELQRMLNSKLSRDAPSHESETSSTPSTTPRRDRLLSHGADNVKDSKEHGFPDTFCGSGMVGTGRLHSPTALRQTRSPEESSTNALDRSMPITQRSPTVTVAGMLSPLRKRNRDSDNCLYRGDNSFGHKNIRLTATPCSANSLDEMERTHEQRRGNMFGNLDYDRRQSMLARQREAENKAHERKERELADAELARQLQNHMQAWSGPDTTLQAVLDGSGGFKHTDPPKLQIDPGSVKPSKLMSNQWQTPNAVGNIGAYGISAPMPSPSWGNASHPVKYARAPQVEPGLYSPSKVTIPGNIEVIDLIGSDSGEELGGQYARPVLSNTVARPASGIVVSTAPETKLMNVKHETNSSGTALASNRSPRSMLQSNMPGYHNLDAPNASSDGSSRSSWVPVALPSGAKALQAFGSNTGGWMDDLTSLNFIFGGGGSLHSNSHGLANPEARLTGHVYDYTDDVQDAQFGRHRPADPMDYLMQNDPAMAARSREDLNRLLANIRPDEDLPPELRGNTPEPMKYPLMEHQKLGLTWLKKMEECTNKGGILADDMGLGKTIQAIALMVARPSEDPRRKTTLIVAPVALMRQWEREIRTKLKGGRFALSVHVHHGSKKKTSFAQLREFDVVLTTFGTLASELKRKDSWDMRKSANPGARLIMTENMALLGDECKWYRVIVDEAQCIKNKDTRSAIAASHLQSLTRFCMTGTPMMNSVVELYSLIHFLRIPPYNSHTKFNHDFKAPLQSTNPSSRESAMRKLQALLRAILLRRTKKSTVDGRPILNLPERVTEITHAVFGDDQRGIYDGLERSSQVQFNRYLKAGTVLKNYSNILVLLLRLRQACCHPHLVTDLGVPEDIATDMSASEMVQLAKGLQVEVVARIKAANGSFECPICYDAVENPAIFYPCGHWSCSECLARLCDPARAIAQGNENSHDAKCPECRGKVSPRSVIDFNTFKNVHSPEEASSAEPSAKTEEDDTESETDGDETESQTGSETESEEDDRTDTDGSDLAGFIVDDDDETESENNGESENPEVKRKEKKGEEEMGEEKKRREKKEKKKKNRKGKGQIKEKEGPLMTLAQLKKAASRNKEAKRRYLRRLRADYISSAKIDKIMEILENTMATTDKKTIIFSQFTSFLDLVEVPIDRKRWTYERYDGSMSATQRNDAVCNFTDDVRCRIMLVSLKAGNAGLNLVAASQVIILDPFWNPYIEEQAIDRAHRIGQLRPVTVHRVLVENTVEDRIIALQEKKRQMIETALDEGESRNMSRLGIQQLSYLFGVSTDMGSGRN